MVKTYDSLPAESKKLVNEIVDKTMGSMKDDSDKVNISILKAVLEQLNEEKKNLKAQIEAEAQEAAKAARDAATKIGRDLVESKKLEKGDVIDFVMGSGKLARVFTLPVEKLGENSVTVEFTSEYPTMSGEAGKRYIQYRKILSIKKKNGTVIAVNAA
jgi:uncharacterized protein YkvS